MAALPFFQFPTIPIPIEEGWFERPFASCQSHCCRSSSKVESPAFPVSLSNFSNPVSFFQSMSSLQKKTKSCISFAGVRTHASSSTIQDEKTTDALDRSATADRLLCLFFNSDVSIHEFDNKVIFKSKSNQTNKQAQKIFQCIEKLLANNPTNWQTDVTKCQRRCKKKFNKFSTFQWVVSLLANFSLHAIVHSSILF